MIIVGLSGPSCSGKSTLARHLRLVLPNAGILYEDDFYLPESALPVDKNGDPNWDCPQSFDVAKLRDTLREIKSSNQLPIQNTREDGNNVSSIMLSPAELASLRAKYSPMVEPVLLVDGIILYHKDVAIDSLLDLKLLVPFDYNSLKERRESRKVYETLEGQWIDPPHFFEEVVWPEFIKHCGNLYVPNGLEYKKLSPLAVKQNIKLTLDSEDMSAVITDCLDEIR